MYTRRKTRKIWAVYVETFPKPKKYVCVSLKRFPTLRQRFKDRCSIYIKAKQIYFWGCNSHHHNPINMPLCASTGPVLVRCCQHRTSLGPVPATSGMFTEYTICVEIKPLRGENDKMQLCNKELWRRSYGNNCTGNVRTNFFTAFLLSRNRKKDSVHKLPCRKVIDNYSYCMVATTNNWYRIE